MDNREGQYEDEINLRDYINVLIKRKVTVIVIFLVCVIGAAVYSFTTPQIYKIEETVKIGKAGGVLMSKEEAVRLIQSKNILQPVVKNLDQDLSVQGLKESLQIEKIENTNLINLSLKHKTPKRAISILKNIVLNFVSQVQVLYQKEVRLLEKQVKTLRIRQASIKGQIDKLQDSIENRDTADFPLIQNTLTNYEQIYSDLDNRIFSLQKQLSGAEKFSVFEAPLEPESPVAPKKKQNIAIAGVLGLFLGVFIAFFREFWVNSSKGEDK